MKVWKIAPGWAACCIPVAASAQNWTVYAPVERDFQVLFPQPPSRMDAGGTAEFRATISGVDYVVFRRDPRREPVDDAVRVMQRHLRAAADDERQRSA